MKRKKELTKKIEKKVGDVERKKAERNGTQNRVKERKKNNERRKK